MEKQQLRKNNKKHPKSKEKRESKKTNSKLMKSCEQVEKLAKQRKL